MDHDFKLAIGGLFHLIDKLHDIAREIVPLVGADWHVPFVGEGWKGRKANGGQAASGEDRLHFRHHGFPMRTKI
ncbi:MAG: hypothetical protein AB7F39_03200 [Variibacter sp.]